GIFVKDGGTADAEIGLDPLDQDAAEYIGPAIVLGDPDAGVLRCVRKAVAIRNIIREGGENIDVSKAGESLRDGEPFGLGERIGRAAAKAELSRLRDISRLTHDCDAIVDQHIVRLAGAVPFEQREFRMMQRAALAIAKRSGELDDASLAGRQ